MIIKQDTYIFASILENGNSLSYDIKPKRKVYIHLVKGKIIINNFTLLDGDAIEITNEDKISIQSLDNSEFILFDLK